MPSLIAGPSWGAHVADPELFAVALTALLVCVLWFAVAAWLHGRHLRAIPVRIHVAGTRGKSTTTRLIAAGLRAGGRVVAAKSTGSQPRFIRPDGTEEPWPRRGPASVREQARFFAKAARLGADSAVVECMAIRPELIWASEAHLVRATLAVITNTRPDHFEELGEEPEAAAEALRWAVPTGGKLVIAAEAASPALQSLAAERGTEVTIVNTEGLGPLAADRALALAVCAAHGVPEAIAGPAMDGAAADPGAFFEHKLARDGKTLRFLNAFACNDVGSLALHWRRAGGSGRPVVLLNARPDRPVRTKHFVEFLAAQEPRPLLFLSGDRLALRLAARAGFAASNARWLGARTPAAALAELAGPAADGGLIWGVGNYQGFGALLIAELTGQNAPC